MNSSTYSNFEKSFDPKIDLLSSFDLKNNPLFERNLSEGDLTKKTFGKGNEEGTKENKTNNVFDIVNKTFINLLKLNINDQKMKRVHKVIIFNINIKFISNFYILKKNDH